MTPVDQEFFKKEEIGDCVRAVTASLLNLPLSSVPHFVLNEPGDAWYDTWEKFMSDRGRPVTILTDWTTEHPPVPSGFYLAAGNAPNGSRHVVVMFGGKMVHDPHPSRAGLKTIDVVWIVGRA